MKGLKMLMIALMLTCQPVAAKNSGSTTAAVSIVSQVVNGANKLFKDTASFIKGFF